MNGRFLVALAFGIGAMLSAPQQAYSADDPVVSGKKVSEWVADLKSGNTGKANSAAEKLGAAGEKAKTALPALIAALGGKDDYLAYTVRNQLGKFGADGAAALVEAAKQKDEKVSQSAKSILRQEYPEASEKAGFGSVKTELAAMKKLDATTTLKDTAWLCSGSLTAKGGTTSSGEATSGSSVVSISFTDKGAEWTSVPNFQSKPGKATYSTDTTKTPARIELKIGDVVYKGVYKVFKEEKLAHAKGIVYMRLEFAGPGEDYPADLSKGMPPKDSKNVRLDLTRVK